VYSLEPCNCEPSDEQHSEMLELVKALNKKQQSHKDLCERGDSILGTDKNLLHAAWHQDVTERII